MSYIIALFLPWLPVLYKGRVGTGLLLLILQLTLLGWLPAVLIAFFVINNDDNARAFEKALEQSRNQLLADELEMRQRVEPVVIKRAD